MRPQDHLPLRRMEAPSRARWLAPLSVMLGSMVPILPFVATFPVLPPLGLMLLLGWRLHRADTMRVWSPVLLGLFDDMLSGQPLGSSMLFWTVACLAIDILDTRLVWRDYWQDWLIASGAIGAVLIAGRLVATPFEAHVDTVLLLQIIISAALFPLVTRLVTRLDRDPSRA